MMRRLFTLSMGFLLLGALSAPAGGDDAVFKKLKVMTQNLYVGTDFTPIVTEQNQELIPVRVAEALQAIIANNFPVRADALADEIARTKPDLIGLQEVALLRMQSPGDALSSNSTPATDILKHPDTGEPIGDYLAILLNALAVRGLDYTVAALMQEVDVELPAFNPSNPGVLDDVRLTDRDVILARGHVEITHATSAHYSCPVGNADPCVFRVSVGGVAVNFLRGFVAVDATVRGKTYRVVNTHLEVQGEDLAPTLPVIQAAQARQLIELLSSETLPILLVGDLNSSPQDPITVLPGPIIVVPPYQQLIAAHYLDIWSTNSLTFRTPESFTCCQLADLTNPMSNLDERIDFIFVRNDLGFLPFSVVGPVFAVLMGDKPLDLVQPNWASDHAGVAATLFLPTRRPLHEHNHLGMVSGGQ